MCVLILLFLVYHCLLIYIIIVSMHIVSLIEIIYTVIKYLVNRLVRIFDSHVSSFTPDFRFMKQRRRVVANVLNNLYLLLSFLFPHAYIVTRCLPLKPSQHAHILLSYATCIPLSSWFVKWPRSASSWSKSMIILWNHILCRYLFWTLI